MNIIRMSGGLGNQMFQYAFYLKLRSLGKEVKFDDINEYRREKAKPIMLAVFGLTYPRATWEEITALTDGSMRMSKRIHRKLFGRHAIEYEEQGFFDPRMMSFDTMYLKGAFQSEKYFADIKEEVKQAYRFPKLEDMHLPEKLYKTASSCLELIESCEAVGLHMYRGDSRTAEELYDDICTEKYYEGAVRFLMDKCPEAKFFIFSNEPKWVKGWVRALVESQITEGMNQEEARRMERRFIMIEANTQHTGYLDMLLMSKCKHNIISNSSFSWWSAWINGNPDKIIVAPDRWRNDEKSDDIYVNGMVLINSKGRVERKIKE